VKLTLSNSDDSGHALDPLSNSASNRLARNALIFATGSMLYWALASLVPYFSGLNIVRLSPFFVGAAGYFLGFRAGVCASLAAVVVHTVVFNRVGFDGPLAILHVKPAVHIGIVLIGPMAGRLHADNQRLQSQVARGKEGEAELREMEMRFRQLSNTVEDALWTCSGDRTRMEYLSPAFEAIFGIPRSKIENNPRAILEFVHPEDRPSVTEMFDPGPETVRRIEFRIKRPDGAERWIISRSLCVPDQGAGQRRIAGVWSDATDSRNTARALEVAQAKYRDLVEKIPAVVYVAPLDPTQPLLYVSPQVEFVLGYPQDSWTSDTSLLGRTYHPDDAAAVIAQLEECIAQNRRFIADYRMIARNGSVRWFHDEADIVRDEAGVPIFVQGVLRDVTRDRDNEAMQHDGRAVRSRGEQFQGLAGAKDRTRREERPDTAGKIVAADPHLPAVGDEVRTEKLTGPSAGSRTVLVAEDEPAVLRRIQGLLQEEGYTVLLAEDGESALAYAAGQGAIDLLITDVVLPRGDGRELADELRSRHPRLKVLFISGYIGSASVRVAELGPDTSFLAKPFSSETLARKIRVLMDTTTPGRPAAAGGRTGLDGRLR